MTNTKGFKDSVSIRLNQEHNLISYCSDDGCKIFNVDPFLLKLHLDVTKFGTLSICEMMHRTNLLALVGGGSRPKFADNTVVVWDDWTKQFVIELTFPSKVLTVRMRLDRMFVAEIDQIHCFSMPNNIRKLFTVSTRNNPRGLFEVSSYANSDRQLLCFPGHRVGSVQILDINKCEPGASSSPVYVNVHENEIACISMNAESTLLATASQKGTLIRVFDTSSPHRVFQIVELRRGSDVATLYCLSFSPDSQFLCASSDKGTVHIFAIREVYLNKRSSFKKMSFLGSYIESQWALANFTVAAEMPCVCAFGKNNTVFAACVDETFNKYSFGLDGSCSRLSFEMFSEMTSDEEEDDCVETTENFGCITNNEQDE